jgi:Arc/MetJ-type ribon-helix-helix transcriptional regulator
MQITLTKPIEEFIQQQLERGYADVSEVARQAFLRWMEDEEYAPDPPRLREKLLAAHHGQFRSYQPETYDCLMTSSDEVAR